MDERRTDLPPLPPLPPPLTAVGRSELIAEIEALRAAHADDEREAQRRREIVVGLTRETAKELRAIADRFDQFADMLEAGT